MPLIEVENLTKAFRMSKRQEGFCGALVNLIKPSWIDKTVVENINFTINEGELVGYIGANGAGKSTTIKMLTGILTPTSGQVTINGVDPQKNRIRNNKQIGTVFGNRSQLWWDLPVIDSYSLLRKIYEVPKMTYQENLDYFIALLNLEDLLDRRVRQLSLGEKMRCEIAAAFIHNPKIVYLDEPTIGLDVMAKESIRSFIKYINKEKRTTIILTTHDLKDIEELCNRVIIIEKGRILYDGSLSEIMRRFGKFSTVYFKINSKKNILRNIFDKESDLLCLIDENEYELKFHINRQKTTITELMNLITPYCNIVDLNITDPSIESIVKDIYRKY